MENHFRKGRSDRAIFLIAGLLIIGISLFLAFKGQDSWMSDPYGTTTAEKMAVHDGDVIRVPFTINSDDFQGINLKFANETKNYVDEELLVWITDAQTEEVLAETRLRLKEIFGQASFFVPLLIEDSENRQVELNIKAAHIIAEPRLCISDSYDQEAALYVNGEMEEGRYLVFSAMYHEKTALDISAIIKGIIYLILLILVYFWRRVFLRAENDRRIPVNKTSALLTWLWKIRRIWILGILTFLYGVLFIFVYENNVGPVRWKKKDIVIGADEAGTVSFTKETKRLEWKLTAKKDNLSALQFKCAAGSCAPDAEIHIQVCDEKYNMYYLDQMVPAGSLPEKTGWWKVLLRNVYKKSKDQVFRIIMEPVSFGDTVAEFAAGSIPEEAAFRKDGEMLGLVPETTVSYGDSDYLRTLYVIFGVLVYGFLLMSYYLIVIRRAPAEKIYLPVTLYLGILYMLIIPVYSVPDEYTHMDTAYTISNQILGIGEPEEHGYGYKRAVDVETDEYFTYYTNLADYRRLYLELFERPSDVALEKCRMMSGLKNGNVLYYLPAAIGITIGRLLGTGTILMYLLGRLMNLSVFLLLTQAAIRKTPGFKNLFMVFAALPIMLQEAASISYDCVLNGFSILFAAYCFYFAAADTEEIRLRDVFILLFSMIQVASVKGGVYLPLCFIVLIIFFERRWKIRRAGAYMLLAAGGTVAAFLQNNAVRLIKTYFFPSGTRISPFVGTELYSIHDVISQPFKIALVFINTIFTEGSRLIYEILGGKMGSLQDIQMPWMYELIFLVVIIFILPYGTFKLKSRVSTAVCMICAIGSAGLVAVSMLLAHTAADLHSVAGLQGRYFFASALVLLVCAGQFVKEKMEETGAGGLLALYFGTHIVFLYNILMVVFPRD